MKDLFGKELEVGQCVAFADTECSVNEVGDIFIGVIASINEDDIDVTTVDISRESNREMKINISSKVVIVNRDQLDRNDPTQNYILNWILPVKENEDA